MEASAWNWPMRSKLRTGRAWKKKISWRELARKFFSYETTGAGAASNYLKREERNASSNLRGKNPSLRADGSAPPPTQNLCAVPRGPQLCIYRQVSLPL